MGRDATWIETPSWAMRVVIDTSLMTELSYDARLQAFAIESWRAPCFAHCHARR